MTLYMHTLTSTHGLGLQIFIQSYAHELPFCNMVESPIHTGNLLPPPICHYMQKSLGGPATTTDMCMNDVYKNLYTVYKCMHIMCYIQCSSHGMMPYPAHGSKPHLVNDKLLGQPLEYVYTCVPLEFLPNSSERMQLEHLVW